VGRSRVTLPTNDAKVVVNFLKKNIFSRFGTSLAIIGDGGKFFCNNRFKSLLSKYGVNHHVATPYHPKQVDKLRFPIES